MGSGDILEEITMIDAFETSGTSPSTGEHESAPQGLIPTQFNRPLPRKPPAKRLFSGMAGSPLARVEDPHVPVAVTVLEPSVTEPAPATGSIVQVQVMVTNLMEAVNLVEGDEKVKQVVRETFAPP